MADSFLGNLADQLSSQYNITQNTTSNLNAVLDGQQEQYNVLGDISSGIDQYSNQRNYVESGYIRRDPYETDPNLMEVLWQQPNATVLVKKKMFSSIADNFRPDFMDTNEKLYYKAMCILFNNKCNQISALEQLSKIQKIGASVGSISDQLLPFIFTLTDQLNNGYNSGSNFFGTQTTSGSNPFTTQDGTAYLNVINRLRTLYTYNQTAHYTTWLTDANNILQQTLGPGNGVIEITNFTDITTNTTTSLNNPGSFNLNIVDPYQSMLMTAYDIEIALSDATNQFYNSKNYEFGVPSPNQMVTDLENQLNALRAARNASPINFNIEPSSITGGGVFAIIQNSGIEIPFSSPGLGAGIFAGLGGAGGISVSADYLEGGNIAGFNGLNSSELSIFGSIINAINQQLSLMNNNSTNTNVSNSDSYKYARRKLQFNFLGKLIIQPMDVIHIYIGSKSRYDNVVLNGLSQMFSGCGILQNTNNNIGEFDNPFSTLFNPTDGISIAAEKSIYVGPEFPNYLWSLLRTQFITEKEGTHVFAGLVENATNSWDNGRFTISVSGGDNTTYFNQGKINFKPGADSFNGLIFDPLTPFKSSFDSITTNNVPGTLELLDENKYLLSDSGSMVKYKLGALAGEKATQGNYIQDQTIDPITGRLTRVFYAPDGLVYQWKQGIGVFTQAGSTSQLNNPNLIGTSNIYNKPFAGLDVMNVLSLLISGVPYNYATFYKATSTINDFSGNPASRQSPAFSFMQGLRTDLIRTNTLWGNFIPFKNLVMNESAIAQAMQAQLTVSNANQDLDTKLKKLNDLQNVATALGAVNVLSKAFPDSNSDAQNTQIQSLTAQISNLTNDISNSIITIQNATKQLYNQVDNSASYDSNYLIDGKNDPADSSARKSLRRQINYLTRRMSYDVRANQDKNLFIVDDYYDIDYDIAAFNQALSNGIPMYSNDFTSVREKIMNVADLLNLEVFADSQGHIRARPPQYNRMPSSVFYRMLYLKQTLGIQIFPDFLNTLFTDQLKTLKNNIEVIEDEIRLNCALLGQYPSLDLTGDTTAQQFINSKNVSGGQASTFSFISDSTDNITNINTLILQANQDSVNSGINQSTGNYAAIKAAGTTTKQLFDNAERFTVLAQILQAQNQNAGGTNTSANSGASVFNSSVVQQLISRISTKSGQQIVSSDYLTQSDPNQPVQISTTQTVDIFKITNNLTTYMQQWQNAIKLFYHTIKNAAEYKSLDDDSSMGNTLQTPGIFNNQNIPEVYEHMIEDETYDDYGPGSGSRYIIHNSQIKSLSISENPPPWTSVEVQGTLPYFEENFGAPGLNAFPDGGNAQVTALAIDYDAWRNYGLKTCASIQVPFLNDPDTQCGPYAAMILTRNRSNVLQGSITIAGNEYMQPGEVIYLEDRGLLFYVNSVRHSISSGSNFSTTLGLIYGHSIGDYIPTYLDTVGKIIYKNQDITNTIIHRQESTAPETNLGIIQIQGQNPTANIASSGAENDSINSYTTSNTSVINNILYNTAYIINANNTAGNNIQANLELRIYYDNNNPINSQLQTQANNILAIFTGAQQGPISASSQNQSSGKQQATIPTQFISVVSINIDDETDRRSPSQQAIDAARNQMANTSVNTGSPTPSNPTATGDTGTNANTSVATNIPLRTSLFSYIIDCWIVSTEVPATVSSNSTNDPGY